MAKPYFYSSDIRGLHRAKLSSFQKKFYAKLYRLRIVEQKRFAVGGAKYTEDLKRFHQLQDEYLQIVNNDIKSVVELVDFIGEQEEKIQQIEDRQKEIYIESSSRKRSIKNEEQYREYQIWHVGVQEELDELKQEKRDFANTDDTWIEEVEAMRDYAVHGNTAAEVIVARADHNKEHMGLKSWKNAPDGKIVKTDVSIAKNYLGKEELAELNEIVTMYLDYATRQARRHIPMTMEDWKTKLDAFLRFNDAEVLQDKGKVTAAIAKEFAESEFEKYRVIQDSLYESDFDKLMNDMEKDDAIH